MSFFRLHMRRGVLQYGILEAWFLATVVTAVHITNRAYQWCFLKYVGSIFFIPMMESTYYSAHMCIDISIRIITATVVVNTTTEVPTCSAKSTKGRHQWCKT